MSERIDHGAEALRIIDATLAAEEGPLAELKLIVSQNGIEGSEEQLIFDAFKENHPS